MPSDQIDVLATLHLSGRNEGLKGKDGGLSRLAMEMVALRDWRKVQRYLAGEWPRPLPPSHVYTTDTARMHAWFDAARQAPYVVIDTEFDRTTRYLTLVGLGYLDMAEVLQVEWPHVWAPRRETFAQHLRDLVRSTRVVFQNALADIPVLAQACEIRYEDYCGIDDTMLAHAVLWSEWPHDLEFLASLYGEHPKLKHLAGIDLLRYNLGDVVDTLSVWEGLRVELNGDPQSERIYRDQSLPLIPLILEAHAHGIRVNVARVAPAAVAYATKAADAVSLARAYCGFWTFQLGSSQQLGHRLYDIEGLPEQRHPKTKQRTVNEEAILRLRELIGEHPLLEARIAFAEAMQSSSHYITPLQGVTHIYPHINIHAQASGRWSITDPPLQQLPKDLEDLLCPDDDEVWIRWDWKQCEPRFLAYLAEDRVMIDTFARGDDPYTQDAQDLFGTVELANGQRDFTKRFRLKLSYGGMPASDTPGARVLGLSKAQLAQAGTRYFTRHPALRTYWQEIDRSVKGWKDKSYIISRAYDGRRRMITGNRAAVQREAKNHPMQGSVAGLLNSTCVLIKHALPYARLVTTKHDDGTFAVPSTRQDEALVAMRAIIEREVEVGTFRVRFPCKLSVTIPSKELT